MNGNEEASRPVVGERGELSLVLAGATMGMRPTYEAIEAIETSLGRGLIDLAREAVTGKLKLGETAQIAAECMRAWGRDAGNSDASGAQAKRVGELILGSDGGFHAALATVSAMLSLAVTGGYTASGNLKPTTMTTTGEAPVVG